MAARDKHKRGGRPIRKVQDAVAVIIDGDTENWYIKQVKQQYNPDVTRKLKITPEFPEKKKVKELFNLAQIMIERETYTTVFLIIDLDEVLKYDTEWNCFKEFYRKYKAPEASYEWMRRLKVIVNNPCLEYWYLLHFKHTERFYKDYASLRPDLRRIPTLSEYEKTDKYYNSLPKIYTRLSEYLSAARENASEFNLMQATELGCSEMFKIFDFIDTQSLKNK